ncbi:MAG: ABC transporter permease [Chitinophagales bacterium]|nr:ABC transporter permease [Chitinophagales bacterium]MDW8418761.1 ABC transporter permease [Chitinophagales bacterium]
MELLKYIASRLLSGITVMFGVILVIFFLFNIMPVNSARLTLGQRADVASVQAIEKEFRLHLPAARRLMLYINDLLPLSLHRLQDQDSPSYLEPDEVKYIPLLHIGSLTLVLKAPYLGKSFQNRRPVSVLIGEKIFPTAMLALSAMLFASALGIVLGTIAAVKQYSVWDNAILVLSTLGISQPAQISGLIIAMVFGYYLADYTGLGVAGSLTTLDMEGEVIVWKNLILPALALGVRPVSIITQLTRSSVLDALHQDYIRTAKAKGLSHFTVIFKHALRNALNPVVTSISGWLAALLTGAVLIESVFTYDGLGTLTINALKMFDFPVVMGCVLFVAFVFVVMNIFTDILYSLLDPRVTVKA